MIGSGSENDVAFGGKSSGSEPRHHDEAGLLIKVKRVDEFASRCPGSDRCGWADEIDVPRHWHRVRRFKPYGIGKKPSVPVVVRPFACLKVFCECIRIDRADSNRSGHVLFV